MYRYHIKYILILLSIYKHKEKRMTSVDNILHKEKGMPMTSLTASHVQNCNGNNKTTLFVTSLLQNLFKLIKNHSEARSKEVGVMFTSNLLFPK